MLYISVRDHARKLTFSSYVHLPSIRPVYGQVDRVHLAKWDLEAMTSYKREFFTRGSHPRFFSTRYAESVLAKV